ncbi:unnamed protein product [Pleuronectes platessa]|uniref:Uncharacterized protein n=1 Tax=Pleuronectes platessa TaxID=8262 RepID=A0A9N7UXT2_PLEPL|nr:unnamed protein product [Pleuronectes platessa]
MILFHEVFLQVSTRPRLVYDWLDLSLSQTYWDQEKPISVTTIIIIIITAVVALVIIGLIVHRRKKAQSTSPAGKDPDVLLNTVLDEKQCHHSLPLTLGTH